MNPFNSTCTSSRPKSAPYELKILICVSWLCEFREITAPPKQRKGPPFIMLVPLIYAPVLPLSRFILFSSFNFSSLVITFFFLQIIELLYAIIVRIGFRRNPVLRDRLFYGVLAGAFAHGTYLMYLLINLFFFNLDMPVTVKLLVVAYLRKFLGCV
jgi:hypothetical protein